MGTKNSSTEEIPLSQHTSEPRYSLHLRWQEDGHSGLLYSYRGRLYNGRTGYNSNPHLGNYPTSTDYTGMTHEGQLISRSHLGSYQLDYVGGLGWDSWRRSTGSSRIEDYSIIFLRTGVNVDQPAEARGFHGGGGLKLPIRNSGNTHVDASASNSLLRPPLSRRANLYAELAYRIDSRWDIVGYFDSWYFSQSDSHHAIQDTGYGFVQPESTMRAFGLKALHTF